MLHTCSNCFTILPIRLALLELLSCVAAFIWALYTSSRCSKASNTDEAFISTSSTSGSSSAGDGSWEAIGTGLT